MKLTVVLDRHTGEARMMHNDELVRASGVPPDIERLSRVEFEDTRWVVRLASDGRFLFEDLRRSKCIEWEHENAAALLIMAASTEGNTHESEHSVRHVQQADEAHAGSHPRSEPGGGV